MTESMSRELIEACHTWRAWFVKTSVAECMAENDEPGHVQEAKTDPQVLEGWIDYVRWTLVDSDFLNGLTKDIAKGVVNELSKKDS